MKELQQLISGRKFFVPHDIPSLVLELFSMDDKHQQMNDVNDIDAGEDEQGGGNEKSNMFSRMKHVLKICVRPLLCKHLGQHIKGK